MPPTETPTVPTSDTTSQANPNPVGLVPPSDLHDNIPRNSPIASYMDWACYAQGSPEAYHLANVLVLAAYTLARRGFALQMTLEDISLTLWFALIGDSGIGKTTSIGMAERFIKSVWKEAGLDIVDPFIEPSGSIPGLLSALQEHYDEGRDTTVAILQHDELAQVFATREPIAELLCKLCDGRDVHHMTKTAQRGKKIKGHSTKLLAPKLSAIFASTEAQLADNFRAAHRAGGMFGRLQWLRPTLTARYVRAPSHDPAEILEAKERRTRAVNAWADWEGRLSALAMSSTSVLLSTEAAKHIDEVLFQRFKADLAKHKNTDNMHGTKMRLVQRTHVIAAIFCLSDLRLVVTLEDAETAVRLAVGLFDHAFAASDLGSSEHNRDCRKVEEIVLASGEMGCERKDIYGRLRVNKRTLDEVLDTLDDRDLVVPDRHRGQSGRYIHTATKAGMDALAGERKARTIANAVNAARAKLTASDDN